MLGNGSHPFHLLTVHNRCQMFKAVEQFHTTLCCRCRRRCLWWTVRRRQGNRSKPHAHGRGRLGMCMRRGPEISQAGIWGCGCCRWRCCCCNGGAGATSDAAHDGGAATTRSRCHDFCVHTTCGLLRCLLWLNPGRIFSRKRSVLPPACKRRDSLGKSRQQQQVDGVRR